MWGTRSTRAAVGRPTGAHACARAGPGESSARRDDLSALGLACRCRRAAPPLPDAATCQYPLVPTAHSSTLAPLPIPPQARLGLAACPNGSEEVHDTNTAAPLCTPQEAGRAAPRTSTHLAPRTHLVLYRALYRAHQMPSSAFPRVFVSTRSWKNVEPWLSKISYIVL